MLKKRPLLAPGLVALLLGSVAVSAPACNSSSSSAEPDVTGGADASHSTAGDGAAGSSDAAGGADSSGPSGNAGAPGTAGSPADGGASNTPAVEALPVTTFLYVRSDTPDSDSLIALDWMSGEERVVTDLHGDGSDGWEIWGHSISPDRTRIALASLYGPTKADNDTGLATRRIWTLAPDGSDFRRLTPVFDNTGDGRTNFEIAVQDPAFTADGSGVIYDFGNYWYEGNTLKGGSQPWLVSTQGDVPQYLETNAGCSVLRPSVNPMTGDVLFVHSVCVKSADEGLFLYPRTGGEPTKLVARGYGPGQVDPSLETASWLADGSGFVFVGNIEVTRGAVTDTATSLLAYDMMTGESSVLVIPDANSSVQSAAISPNAEGIVYCLRHDEVYDLHVLDLTQDPPVDAPITNDGKSCSPGF